MLQNIINILLALMILLSTTGITISKHYCQEQLKGIAVFVEAQNCHEAKESCCMTPLTSTTLSCCTSNSKEAVCNTDNNDCCHNEINYVKNSDQPLIQSDVNQSINFEVVLVAILSYSYLLVEPNSTDFNYTSKTSPPLLHRNSRVLMQSFLC